ncbi:hypothetical protein KRX11_04495 [Pasteurellaceae bacterium TAE3-ERU1]|nr:hypothetical protein [Pasteurellaceae bacterium TAE3-ERU1]
MYYRKKPVIIKAHKVEYLTDLPDWIAKDPRVKINLFAIDVPRIVIKTLEGDMAVHHGDYIVQGIKGELYPCKPDVFEETYEPM